MSVVDCTKLVPLKAKKQGGIPCFMEHSPAMILPATMRYAVRIPFLSPGTMPPEIQIQQAIDVEQLRARLRGMKLRCLGKANRRRIAQETSELSYCGSRLRSCFSN